MSETSTYREEKIFGITKQFFPLFCALLLLPILFIPTLGDPYNSARLALMLVIGIPGLYWLVLLALKGPAKIPSRFLLFYILITGLAVIGAPDKLLGLFGIESFDSGYLLVCLSAGLFALAAKNIAIGLSNKDWQFIKIAISVGIIVNGIVAVFQHFSSLNLLLPNNLEILANSPSFALFGNPVYLAEFITAGSSFLILTTKTVKSFYQIPIGISSMIIALSTDRMALFIIITLLFLLLIVKQFRRSLSSVPFLAFGYIIGLYMSKPYAHTHLRFTSSALNINQRFILWKHLAELDLNSFHILTGYGPSQTFALLIYHPSKALFKNAPGYFFSSPHNILVEALTSGGIFGLTTFIGFLISCAFSIKNELAIYSIVAGIFHLIEPSLVATNGIWFLSTGLMMVPRNDTKLLAPSMLPKANKLLFSSLSALGLIASLWLILGQLAWNQSQFAIAHFTKTKTSINFPKLPFIATRYLLSFWPIGDSTMADYYTYLASVVNKSYWTQALDYREQAFNMQKENPVLCNEYAKDLARAGHQKKSIIQYKECVKIYPYNTDALYNLYANYYYSSNKAKSNYYYYRLCFIYGAHCPPPSQANPNNLSKIIRRLNAEPNKDKN